MFHPDRTEIPMVEDEDQRQKNMILAGSVAARELADLRLHVVSSLSADPNMRQTLVGAFLGTGITVKIKQRTTVRIRLRGECELRGKTLKYALVEILSGPNRGEHFYVQARDVRKLPSNGPEKAPDYSTQDVSRAAQKLKIAESLEKSNPKAALEWYREVIEIAPESAEAAKAQARIKALSKP
jgi:hypothetical protein